MGTSLLLLVLMFLDVLATEAGIAMGMRELNPVREWLGAWGFALVKLGLGLWIAWTALRVPLIRNLAVVLCILYGAVLSWNLYQIALHRHWHANCSYFYTCTSTSTCTRYKYKIQV